MSEESFAGRAVVDMPSPNWDERPARCRPGRYAGPALYRHGLGRGRARTHDGPCGQGQRALVHRRGRHPLAAGARGTPRMARRGERMARPPRGERFLNWDRAGQSRPRARVPAVPSCPDGCLARPRPCHRRAPSHRSPQRGGAFRYRADAQAGPWRALRLGVPFACGHRRLARRGGGAFRGLLTAAPGPPGRCPCVCTRSACA